MDASTLDDIKTATISLVIIMNITLNVLLIAVIGRYPQLREDRTTLFMFSLTLSDLANGCTAMPISAAVCSSATPNVRTTSRYLPKTHAFLLTWFCVTSLQSLCCVAMCKMVAITTPLRYEQILTRTRCYYIICGVWLTGAMTGAFVAYFAETWDLVECVYEIPRSVTGILVVVTIIAIVCPAIFIVYATTRIFLAIFRAHRQITAQVNSIGGENGNTTTTPSLMLKSIISGRNVLIICLTFLIQTMPFSVYIVVDALGLAHHLPASYKFAATWILLSNSTMNSLMYIILFQFVREKVVQMVRGFCGNA